MLRMQRSQRRANEPFTGHVLRLIRSVRQTEARFDVAAEACCLRSLRPDKGMEVFISNKTLQIEQPGVSPICGEEQIGRTRARLQTCRQSSSVCVRQVRSP